MKIRPLHPQGARGARHIPARFVQRPQDVFPFSRFACLPQVGARRRVLSQADFNRDGIGCKFIVGCQDGHPFNDVAQLARVSRPGIALQYFVSFVVDRFGMEVIASAEIVQKVVSHGGNILRPLTQRRNANRHDAQPVIKIFAEFLLGDEIGQASVGGRYDANRNPDDLLAAHAMKLTFLENAQQLGLRAGVQIAHLLI